MYRKPRTKLDWNEVEDNDEKSEASPAKIETTPPVVNEALKTEVPQYIPPYVTPEYD